MAYLLENVNNFKNKSVEQIVLANNMKDLLSTRNPFDINLRSLLDSTCSDLSNNEKYYKGNFDLVKVDEIKDKLSLNEKEFKELNSIMEKNDINIFLEHFKNVIYTKCKDRDVKIYDIVGIYTETINALSTKKFINVDYMNQMVESISKLDTRVRNIDVNNYLINKVVEYKNIFDKYPNNTYYYLNLQKIRDAYEEIKNENITQNEAIKMFYESVKDIKTNGMESINHEKMFINDGFAVKDSGADKDIAKFTQLNLIKSKIKTIVEQEKIDVNTVKEALKVFYLDKEDLIKFIANEKLFNKIQKNELLNKFNTHKQLEKIGLNNDDIEKILTLKQVTNFNSLVNEFSGTDLNVNATYLFYEKFGVDINKASSKKYVDTLFKKFQDLKETSISDKNNILILIALSSFDSETKKYDKNMEKSYLDLLQKPFTKYTKEDFEVLHTIKDKWLQWSICYNREIKDTNLHSTCIIPERFDFVNYQKLKKELNVTDVTPVHIEVIQCMKNFKSLDIKGIGIENLIPNTLMEKDLIEKFLTMEEYKIDLSSYKIKTRDEFYDTLLLYNEINKNEKLINTVNEANVPIEFFFKSNKESITHVLNNLNKFNDKDIKAIGVMLENTKVIPGQFKEGRELDSYIKYYSKQMEKKSYQDYTKENSLIPIFDNQINKKYEIRALTVKEFASVLNGEVANHCMSYEGASWKMLEYMFNNPTKMYITQVEREGKGISNAATWLKEDTICFDSVEVVTSENTYRDTILNSYREYAMKLLLEVKDKNINRITMGKSDHNNKDIDFTDFAISHNKSTHQPVTISKNEIGYSDALCSLHIVLTLNSTDLLSTNIINHSIKSLKEYSKFQDCKPDLLKDYLFEFKLKLDDILESNPSLKSSVEYDVLEQIERNIEIKNRNIG